MLSDTDSFIIAEYTYPTVKVDEYHPPLPVAWPVSWTGEGSDECCGEVVYKFPNADFQSSSLNWKVYRGWFASHSIHLLPDFITDWIIYQLPEPWELKCEPFTVLPSK